MYAFCAKVANHDYLSVVEDQDVLGAWKAVPGEGPGFKLIHYRIDKKELSLHLAPDDALFADIRAGRIKGTVHHGGLFSPPRATLEDTPQNVQAYFLKNQQRLFADKTRNVATFSR